MRRAREEDRRRTVMARNGLDGPDGLDGPLARERIGAGVRWEGIGRIGRIRRIGIGRIGPMRPIGRMGD